MAARSASRCRSRHSWQWASRSCFDAVHPERTRRASFRNPLVGRPALRRLSRASESRASEWVVRSDVTCVRRPAVACRRELVILLLLSLSFPLPCYLPAAIPAVWSTQGSGSRTMAERRRRSSRCVCAASSRGGAVVLGAVRVGDAGEVAAEATTRRRVVVGVARLIRCRASRRPRGARRARAFDLWCRGRRRGACARSTPRSARRGGTRGGAALEALAQRRLERAACVPP